MAGQLTISTLRNDTGVLSVQNGMTGIPKAWVQFAGASGTIAGSFNISSVTRNGTGNYTINFTTAMSNANYAFAGNAQDGGSSTVYIHSSFYAAPTTSSFRTYVYNFGGTPSDVAYTYAAFFGA
jgi:hypothetical protein